MTTWEKLNPDGKKRSWKQHVDAKRRFEEEQAKKHADRPKNRYGVCPICGNKGFRQKVVRSEFIRVCKQCGEEKVL